MHTPNSTTLQRPAGTRKGSRFVLSVSALTLLLLGSLAHAQSSDGPMYTTPGYADFSVGSSDFSKPSNGIGIFSNDQRATAYSISMGNYVFTPNWGMEVGYTDFGSVNRAGGRTTADGINIHLIGRMPLNPSWNLLGKLGTTYGRTDVTSSPSSGVSAGNKLDFGLSYGIGLEAMASAEWSWVLQYEEHTMNFPGGSADRISNAKVGLRYRY